MVVQWITLSEGPLQMCTQMQLCDPQMAPNENITKAKSRNEPDLTNMARGKVCAICEVVVQVPTHLIFFNSFNSIFSITFLVSYLFLKVAESYMSSSETEERIVEGLKSFCHEMPHSYGDQVQAFDNLFDFILFSWILVVRDPR